MNINYDNDNLIVQYLQYFLRDYSDKAMRMSGIFDKYTHQKLVEYLDMPNIKDPANLIDELQKVQVNIDSFQQSNEIKLPLQKPFQLMQVFAENDSIVFFFKNPRSVKGFNENYPVDKIQDERFKMLIPVLRRVYTEALTIIESSGWKIVEYPSMYSTVDTVNEEIVKDLSSITVVLEHRTPSNIFPHFDVRYMINYFQNEYINDIEISSRFFRKSSKYRVALIKCKPGDTFVLSHGYTYSVPIKVGYSTENINDIKDIIYTNNNSASLVLHNVNQIADELEASGLNNFKDDWKFVPGTPMLIKVPINNYKYQTMVIQLPYLSYNKQSDIATQTPLSYIDIRLMAGDINNDGEVDEIDRLILASQRPNETGNEDGIFYFNEGYERYDQLVECIERKYRNRLFYNNTQDVGSRFEQYNHKYIREADSKANIDIIIEHLKLLCNGSDIKFQRFLINNEVNYKIVINEKDLANKNITVLNSSDYYISLGEFDVYLSEEVHTTRQAILNAYINDDSSSDIGYSLSNNISSGVKIICGSNMSSNNLLVIKTNPEDDVDSCVKITKGIYNNEDNLSLILPIQDFKDNPWIIHSDFLPALLDNMTNPYSNQEDIAYIYYLAEANVEDNLTGMFGGNKFIFSDNLRDYLKKLQNRVDSPFALGYFDKTAYKVMFKSAYNNYVSEIDRIMGVEGYA